jgi:hypothetical protein
MNESPTDLPKPVDALYERRDVDTISMMLLVVLLVICAILVHLAMAGMLSVLKRHAESGPSARIHVVTTSQFPAPRLQLSPQDDLKEFRERENERLNSYGWVDRKAGVARIPVDRAMDLLVQRGLSKTSDSVTSTEWQQKRPEQNGPRPTFPQEGVAK